jgi:hypothetical protein
MNVSKYLAVAAVAAGIVGSAFAEEEVPSVGAYAYSTLKNGYLSNGYVFYDDAVLQSGAGVTFAGFDLNVWNSYGVGSSYDRKHYGTCDASEVDYEIDYYGDFEDFDYMLGVASWTYPHDLGDKTFDEWVGKIAVGYNAWVVRPELNARFGLDGQQGCYGQFKLSKSFTLTDDEKLSLNVYGLVAYASKSYRAKKGVDDDGFVDTEFGAELGYAVSENFSVNCGCQLSAIIDSDLRDAIDDGTAFMADGDKEHFMYYAGISLGF